MANRYELILGLAGYALRKKTQQQTPQQVLEAIIDSLFDANISDGKTLISTMEAGGTATFAMMQDLTPAEILGLLQETIVWIQQQPDPTNYNPYPARRIKRFRASFSKAMI